ncbi:NAD(P)/FAD-dependent oxidoreductase [Halomicrobium sp. LC1Hm]|uniref:NAD(P)/FAD-dependent oxidoreductase n=1 Tax=Halomicrobium sp. LC1Hm TaxID=2610902 RepID=UPI0012982AA8|nr:NAD(P)/FAD-dependent oxidoreductase [Halomicrobium sp. LC1Hm]QGA83950.1 Thioredoxin reductase [Halomicrobium sp. LC1Hm]
MPEHYDVLIVGGGVAGLSAGVFTARADFETLVLDAGGSILRRNAHLENVPGFPAGIDARQFLDLLGEQVQRAGAQRRLATVETVTHSSDGFTVETDAGERYTSDYVIAATKNETSYLSEIDGVGLIDRGKTFVDTDEHGRTGIEGLYAAGRLAEKPHQAVVCTGHGAEVAVTLLTDDDAPFYHDWVVPEGYFTDRGRDLPPGCEEIDADERRRREERARERLREMLAEPHPEPPETHPSLTE